MTGPSEAWFIVPFDSHQAIGDSLKRESDAPRTQALHIVASKSASGTMSSSPLSPG